MRVVQHIPRCHFSFDSPHRNLVEWQLVFEREFVMTEETLVQLRTLITLSSGCASAKGEGGLPRE